MERQRVFNKVRAMTVELWGVESDEVTEEAQLIDDLGLDSLSIVELIMAIEEEFEIEIPDEGAEKINTVQEAVDYIMARLN